jgi:hypothetical protein
MVSHNTLVHNQLRLRGIAVGAIRRYPIQRLHSQGGPCNQGWFERLSQNRDSLKKNKLIE